MGEQLTPKEQRVLLKTLARANEQGWGIVFGSICGLGLFVATAILVLKGGPNPGQHLSMLRVYFPGYSVTWLGSIVGFVYAFVGGYAIGRTVATVYNRLSPD